MWIYEIPTGKLFDKTGICVGRGYSGNGADLDNPAAENVVGHGPIPEGDWQIGKFETYPHLGELAAPLTPMPGNTMDGREGGFFMHGDNAKMNFTASDGCIIQIYDVRLTVSISGDNQLRTVRDASTCFQQAA
jgi:hypothetical protein